MDLNLIKREIKENLDFHDTVDILKESINKIKTLSGNDVDFKRLLGEIVSLSLPKLEGDEIKETKLKQMDLIYRCQYRQLSSFEQQLMDLFYKASEDNRGLLSIAFPYEGEAFKKYGNLFEKNKLVRLRGTKGYGSLSLDVINAINLKN